MFKKCLENQIVLQEGHYKCCLCPRKLKQSFELVLTHLDTSLHKKRFKEDEKQRKNQSDVLLMPESVLRQIVENSITFDRCLNSFYCHLCKKLLSELYNTFEHIEGMSHRIAVKKFGLTDKIGALNRSQTSVYKLQSESVQNIAQALDPKLISMSITTSTKSDFIICDESYYCTNCKCKLISTQNDSEYNQECIFQAQSEALNTLEMKGTKSSSHGFANQIINQTQNSLQKARDKSLKKETVLEEKSSKSCISEIYCCITCQAFLEDSADVQCHVMIHLFKEFQLLNDFDVLQLLLGTDRKLYLKCLLCDYYCLPKMSDAHEFLKEHFRTEKHLQRSMFFEFIKNNFGLRDMDEKINSLDLKKFTYNTSHNIYLLKHPESGEKNRYYSNDHYYKCFMCNTSFCNASKLFDHYKTPAHKWKIEALNTIEKCLYTNFIRSNEMEILACSLCNTFFSDSRGTMEHIVGRKHNEKMKLMPTHQGNHKNMKRTSLDQVTDKVEDLISIDFNRSQTRRLPFNAKSKPCTPRVEDQKNSFVTNDLLNGKTFMKFCIDPGSENIFNLDGEKISLMELGTTLTFPHSSDRVCIPCKETFPADVESLFEHLQDQEHQKIIYTIIQIDEEEFGTAPDKFSDLRLAKLYMYVSGQSIKCHACDIEIEDDDDIIRQHAKGSIHREVSKFLKKQSEQLFNQCLTIYKDIWYYAEVFYCEICYRRFNTEIDFSMHLTHKEHIKKIDELEQIEAPLKFDLCLPCTTYWFGRADFYEVHCQSEFHKRFAKNKDFMVPNLTIIASEFLDNIDKNANLLVSESDKVDLEIDKETELLKAIVEAVKPTYPNAEAYVFGSRLSHLAFTDSDVDVFLDCENVYYRGSTKEQNQRCIKTIRSYFECIPDTWKVDEVVLNARVPIMKMRHIPTNLHCDISFVNGLSVEKSRLVGIYNRAFPICRKLILFMKKWLIRCRLFGSSYLTTFAISWCVIFYLQLQGILPSVHELIESKMESKTVDGWECGFEEIIIEESSNLSFKEYLKGFFTYFANFDYQRSVISPFLGKTIDKHKFAYIDELPPEIDIYKKRLKDNKLNIFRFDSSMCIQDPVDLSQNLTKAIRKQQLRCFRHYCSLSAEKC